MEEERRTKWQGYADYETVLKNVAERVERALDAHAHIVATESQMQPLHGSDAVETKKALLSAGMRLKPEVYMNRQSEPFDEIWARWEGEDGHLRMLREVDLVDEVPGWLDVYAQDVMDAAWHLGYMRAGTEAEDSPDEDEQAARELID